MIRVGINKGIFLNNAVFEPHTDKMGPRLRITFEESGVTKYANAFERMNADEAVESLPTRDIIIFGPMEPQEKNAAGNMRTEEQKVSLINSDLTSTKAILLHIMEGYLVKEDRRLNLYEGTGVDANNYNQKILKKEVFYAVFKNMATQFIEKMKPFFNESTKQFRLLLIRQDAGNAFPTIRRKYITENPFWEPMEIDEKESKVKFTEYEIKEGLDNDLPASKKDADKTNKGNASSNTPPQTAAGVFGVE